MNDMRFEEYLSKMYNTGGVSLLAYSLDKMLAGDGNSKSKLPNPSEVALKERIISRYIEKIVSSFKNNKPKTSLHFEQNRPVYTNQYYSNFDRAIVLTCLKYDKQYQQGISPVPGIEVAKRCVLDFVENESNRFTRDVDDQGISGRKYAYSYAASMIKNYPDSWKKLIYKQMIYDISRDMAEKFERIKNYSQAQFQRTISNPIITTVSNVKSFFPHNYEKTKSIIQSGVANKMVHAKGKAYGMYYCQDIGRVRKNQEDALLIMEHPRVKDLRIGIVSDGMGGLDKGEVASHLVVEEFKNWFASRGLSNTNFINDELLKEIEQIIYDISKKIRTQCGPNTGATLTGAIIGKDKALVMNVGDSRTYKIKKGEIKQVTVDHSISHEEYEKKYRHIMPDMTEDEMRFYNAANTITRYVGAEDRETSKPDFTVLDIREFDQLLLCSDGVSDCISFKDIATCIKTTNIKDLPRRLIEFVNTTVSVNPRMAEEEMKGLKNDFHLKKPAGKDNSTALVIDK